MTSLGVFGLVWRSARSRWKPVVFLFMAASCFMCIRVAVIIFTDTSGQITIVDDTLRTRLSAASVQGTSTRNRRLPEENPEDSRLKVSIDEHRRDCSSVVRPGKSQIRYRNGYWQAYQKDSKEIYVMAAFYDDRTVCGPLPFIRAHVVDRNVRPGDVHCYVWYPGFDYPYVTRVELTSTGRGEIIDGRKYDQNMYSCQLPVSYLIPSHLSLALGGCANSSIYVGVTAPVRSAWSHEFGVCVAISFGSIPPAEFVEWIEINRMLGVGEFNIYDGNLAANMSDVLSHYGKQGVVRVFSMPPPVMDFSTKSVKLGSPASLNDCMLRNAYRYSYIVVVDFDEVIVPRQRLNYSELLAAVDRSERLQRPWHSYTFRNAYFFRHFPEDEAQPRHLMMVRRRYRAPPSDFLFAPKSIIDPKACLSVFNHYCWKRFPSTPQPWTVDVKTTLALSHHYRKCALGKEKCDGYSAKKTLDDVMLRYKPELDLRVRRVLNDLHYDLSKE